MESRVIKKTAMKNYILNIKELFLYVLKDNKNIHSFNNNNNLDCSIQISLIWKVFIY